MSDHKAFRDLADPEAARATIDRLDLAAADETVSLAEADGRVLAERVDAGIDVPGFDRASMDGYAVRAADTAGADEADPATLERAGVVHAGQRPDVTVEPGTAVEISTGAVMPAGADAVVMVERTDRAATDEDGAGDGGGADDVVRIRTSVAPGDHVMLAGADLAAGQRALGPGTVLTAREIGLLSALGVQSVPVRGRPIVGIVSTGDELVRPGESLAPERGQIYDVNTYTIATGVREAGGEPVVYPHAGDDVDALEATLLEAADECDLVLSSGSTSASAVDVVYRVIEDRGELLLHGVAVKPGKPMLVGRLGGSAYVGLPGYPVSALTIFRTFVAPAIRDAAGLGPTNTATVEAAMAVQERYAEGRLRYLPVGLIEDSSGATLAYPVDKGSGATTSLVEADGVVAVEPDTEYLAAGETVIVELFSPDVRVPSLLAVGEPDPAWHRVLDRLERPRFLPFGSREGRRRLDRTGVPDVAVVAGPLSAETPGKRLGGWTREWGLVVPQENPAGLDGLADLVDSDAARLGDASRFANLGTGSGVRGSLDAALGELAEDRGVERAALTDAIDGYGVGRRGVESPARAVQRGDATVGLGLRTTAERLELGFVPVGEEPVSVIGNPERTAKAGVGELVDVLQADLPDILAALAGYGAD